MKVMIKYPGRAWTKADIANTLPALQEIVGGHIEVVTINSSTVAICNEEGRIRGLEPNCRIGSHLFVGPVILAGVDGEEFTDYGSEVD